MGGVHGDGVEAKHEVQGQVVSGMGKVWAETLEASPFQRAWSMAVARSRPLTGTKLVGVPRGSALW